MAIETLAHGAACAISVIVKNSAPTYDIADLIEDFPKEGELENYISNFKSP